MNPDSEVAPIRAQRLGVRQLALPLTRILILIDNGRVFCDTLGHGNAHTVRAYLYASIDPAFE
jgi:hypothetical protein